MRESTLQTELWLPRPRSEVFPFFAEARNLETLTPPWLDFEVLTPAPIEMQTGTTIDYRSQAVRRVSTRFPSEPQVAICSGETAAEWDLPFNMLALSLDSC
jgi:hypothetical protein